jgi:hypothetical protein
VLADAARFGVCSHRVPRAPTRSSRCVRYGFQLWRGYQILKRSGEEARRGVAVDEVRTVDRGSRGYVVSAQGNRADPPPGAKGDAPLKSALWGPTSRPGGLAKSRRCLAIGLLECGTEVAVARKTKLKCQIGDIFIVFEQV